MKLNIHKVGFRNIKTALAVMICMLIFQAIGRENPFYACIAAVICMKDTVSSSFTMGKNRLIGTLIGALTGLILIYLVLHFKFLYNIIPVVTALGIVMAIYVCNMLYKPGSVVISCIVVIGIMVNHVGPESYTYAIGRSIDTAVGILVAILLNKYFNPPTEN